MPTKQEIREWINDLRDTLPILAVGSNVEYASGVNTALNLFEDEFCGEDGVKKDEY